MTAQELCKRYGLTVAETARRLGLSRNTVANWAAKHPERLEYFLIGMRGRPVGEYLVWCWVGAKGRRCYLAHWDGERWSRPDVLGVME